MKCQKFCACWLYLCLLELMCESVWYWHNVCIVMTFLWICLCMCVCRQYWSIRKAFTVNFVSKMCNAVLLNLCVVNTRQYPDCCSTLKSMLRCTSIHFNSGTIVLDKGTTIPTLLWNLIKRNEYSFSVDMRTLKAVATIRTTAAAPPPHSCSDDISNSMFTEIFISVSSWITPMHCQTQKLLFSLVIRCAFNLKIQTILFLNNPNKFKVSSKREKTTLFKKEFLKEIK